MLPTWTDLQHCSAQERMFRSIKGCGIVSCRVMNQEQHETGVGEGRSCVITAGQPSQILIKITNKPFEREDDMRISWEPARLTLSRAARVPIWETGTTTLPYQCRRETYPGRRTALGKGSATPGWSMFSQQPPRIRHRSWASPVMSIPNIQLRHQVFNPSSKSSVMTLLICKSTFLKEIQLDPQKRVRRDLPPLTPRPSGDFKSFKHWKIQQEAARSGKETYW